MNKKFTGIVASLAAGMVFAGSVSAASLVSNHDSMAKSSNQTAQFEFLNDKDVYGVQFDIRFDKSVSGIDTSTCLANLPDGFSMSRCQLVDDGLVRVMVLSADRKAVPDGLIAQVSFDGAGIQNDGAFAVENVIFGSRSGEKVEPDFVDRGAENIDLPKIPDGNRHIQ